MSQYFRSVEITPDAVPAGDSVEFIVRLVMGRDCPADPCRIVLDCPATLGMSRPSLIHQEDDGFVEVYVSNPAVTWTKTLWDMERQAPFSREKQGFRGMACRLFLLDLSAGLVAGDVVEIHWGDAGGGFGPGAKVTSVVPRPDYRADVHVRLFLDPETRRARLGSRPARRAASRAGCRGTRAVHRQATRTGTTSSRPTAERTPSSWRWTASGTPCRPTVCSRPTRPGRRTPPAGLRSGAPRSMSPARRCRCWMLPRCATCTTATTSTGATFTRTRRTATTASSARSSR